MTQHSIAAIESIRLEPSLRLTVSPQPQTSFATMMLHGVERVNESLNVADATLQAVAVGEAVPPHQAILAMEEAKMNLQLALQIRNKAVEGFQELMRMQI
jgi:flagellar hook-basal body complex protein FliE